MRYKKTEVCQACAQLKNVCQTCLLGEFGATMDTPSLPWIHLRVTIPNACDLKYFVIVLKWGFFLKIQCDPIIHETEL